MNRNKEKIRTQESKEPNIATSVLNMVIRNAGFIISGLIILNAFVIASFCWNECKWRRMVSTLNVE